jgi:SAM-dependent methyltransferase
MSAAAPDGVERPQARYRREFRRRIIEFAPGRVLDVGCGDGGLLKFLIDRGIDCAGVEVNADLVEDARAADLDVRCAAAEALPFDDASFDILVSEFSAHHFENLKLAMSEAARVARRAVFTLDQHYSPALPGHALAEAFDRACKIIDRANGDIHHDAYAISEFAEALAAEFDEIDIVRLLENRKAEPALARKRIDEVVAGAADQQMARRLIAPLAARIAAEGLMEDGSLIICARRLAGRGDS